MVLPNIRNVIVKVRPSVTDIDLAGQVSIQYRHFKTGIVNVAV